MRHRPLLAASLPLVVALAAGCPRKDPDLGDKLFAAEAADANDGANTEGGLFSVATDDVPMAAGGLTAEAIATSAANNAGKHLLPAGCVTATAAGATVTYVLDDCTGPHGLIHVTGTVTVTFDAQAAGVAAHGSATDLHVNGATYSFDSDAMYTMVDGRKQVAVATQGNGTGPRGHAFTREGNYVFAWDGAGCHTLDGAWSTTGEGGRKWSTTVAGLARCKGMCPTAGTITHTGGLTGVTITITFDGSADAHWVSSRGGAGDVTMLCVPG